MQVHATSKRAASRPLTQSLLLFLCLLCGALRAAPAAGQAVTGRIVGDSQSEPVVGAVVILIDAAGTPVRGVLTNESGRFVLPAAPGSYRIRAEMIGRKTVQSEVFTVGLMRPAVVELALPSVPIQLEEVLVRASSRCETGPDVGIAALRVWEEVKKALRAETVTRERGLYEFAITTTRRTRDPNTMQVVDRTVDEGRSVAVTPFRTLSPAEIAMDGYARELDDERTVLYGPNTAVLLSAEFEETHCFSLKQDDDRLGLVFKPVPGRRVTDIEGILWVDRGTAELQRLEFKYKRVPNGLAIGRYAGFLEFQRLESGAWIIGRWQLTTPVSMAESEVTSLEPVQTASLTTDIGDDAEEEESIER
jgi:hypothetical protein